MWFVEVEHKLHPVYILSVYSDSATLLDKFVVYSKYEIQKNEFSFFNDDEFELKNGTIIKGTPLNFNQHRINHPSSKPSSLQQ